MMRFLFFIFALCLIPHASYAAEEYTSVIYGCGTKPAGGAFYSELGKMQCSDEPGSETKEIGLKDQQVFCFYNAECLPLTLKTREALLEAYNLTADKKTTDIMKISDDDLNQTMFEAGKAGAIDPLKDLNQVAVQCIGTKVNGKVTCPGVNACVNNRGTSSLVWGLKPYDFRLVPKAADSKGFKIRRNGDNIVEGVKR